MLKLTPAWPFGIALKMFERTFGHQSTGCSQGSSSLIWPSGGWRRFSEIRHFICKVSPSHQDTRIEEGACVGLMLMLRAGANFHINFLRAAMLKLTPAWQFGIALKMFEKTFCHMGTGLSQAMSSLIWSAGCWKGFSEIHHVTCKVSPSHQDTRIEEGARVGLMLMLKTGANFRSADGQKLHPSLCECLSAGTPRTVVACGRCLG